MPITQLGSKQVLDGTIKYIDLALISTSAATVSDSIILSDASNNLRPRELQQAIKDVGGVLLSGSTANYLTKFSLTNNTIVNSIVYDTGTNIGISTTNPIFKLDISGASTSGVGLRVFGDANYGGMATFTRGGNYQWGAGIGGASSTNGIPVSYFGITELLTTPRFVIAHTSGNVGIGTTAPSAKLEVIGDVRISGTLYATAKSFLIDHPTKENYYLKYGSLEGPENGVYFRGKLKESNIIELPDYWKNLVDMDTLTVHITSIGRHNLYVKEIKGSKIIIAGALIHNINCYFIVYAERKDVEKLIVEYKK